MSIRPVGLVYWSCRRLHFKYFDFTVAPLLLFERECLQTEGKSLNYKITGFITYCIGEIMLVSLS